MATRRCRPRPYHRQRESCHGTSKDYVTNKDLPVRLRVDSAESQPDKKKWNNEFNRPAVKIL